MGGEFCLNMALKWLNAGQVIEKSALAGRHARQTFVEKWFL
jgi:hypothetical protein